MFKIVLTALATAVSTVSFARSKAATEAWVMNYVSNQVATVKATMTETHTNGVTTISISENNTNLIVTVEDPIMPALVLRDCAEVLAACGITNSMIFAHTGSGVYLNGANVIRSTATNLVLNATYQSREFGGSAWFVDAATNRLARVSMTLVQPSVASRLTGN